MIADLSIAALFSGCPACALGQAREGANLLLFAAIALLPLLMGGTLVALFFWRQRRGK
jgi:hypothetical protein